MGRDSPYVAPLPTALIWRGNAPTGLGGASGAHKELYQALLAACALAPDTLSYIPLVSCALCGQTCVATVHTPICLEGPQLWAVKPTSESPSQSSAGSSLARPRLRSGPALGKFKSSFSHRPHTLQTPGSDYRPLCGPWFPGCCWEPAPGSATLRDGVLGLPTLLCQALPSSLPPCGLLLPMASPKCWPAASRKPSRPGVASQDHRDTDLEGLMGPQGGHKRPCPSTVHSHLGLCTSLCPSRQGDGPRASQAPELSRPAAGEVFGLSQPTGAPELHLHHAWDRAGPEPGFHWAQGSPVWMGDS